jgi:RNA polymerase sigma-70 factor (ECF subfamily)
MNEQNGPSSTTTENELPDEALVERARTGDAQAFTTLIERHQRTVYRVSLRMLQNEAEAEEVLQETFLSAWDKLPAFRGESAFGSWVHRIASNFCLMRLRRRRRAPDTVAFAEEGTSDLPSGPRFTPEGGYETPPGSDWSMRADDALHNRQLREAIEQAVANLSDDYRVVFLMKDVDGLSNEQIGDALGLSVPAVKSRLHRARLALREKLSEFFVRSSGAVGDAP